MTKQYNSYRAAAEAAREESRKVPVALYVSWIEDNYYELSIHPEYETQEYYLCGECRYVEDY